MPLVGVGRVGAREARAVGNKKLSNAPRKEKYAIAIVKD